MKIVWKDIPEKYKYVAMDQSGAVYAYVAKPTALENAWAPSQNSDDWLMLDCECYDPPSSWKHSLQFRP